MSDLKDQEARREIMEDLDSCILVEAGAGSGKTYSLVQRMVALIKEGKCTVEQLAAVTFTRKAAAELQGRFQLALEKALVGESGAVQRERLNLALNRLDRCFLGTIHSFCAALLRERPVEAGLDPDFVELESLEDELLQGEVWEEYLIKTQLENPQALAQLLEIGVDPRELKGCYETLSSYPEVEVVRDAVPAPDLRPVREELDNLLDWAQGVLPCEVPPKGWDPLQGLLREALWRRKVFGFDDSLRFLGLLADLDREGNVTQNRWDDAEDARAAREVFNDFRQNYITPVLRAWREHRHACLVDFVLPAVELFASRRREQSKLNFQDLLMSTAALLRENPEVRRYFQERYTHLLVDEFQDTDPIQAQIMFYLTGQDLQEKEWHRLVPWPGSLFVVGDPKQAIYRFRRADIDTYNEVKRLIVQSGGKVLHLTTNFRSVKAIGDWVNPVFQELLPAEATSYQAAFASIDTVRDNGVGKACGVRTITIPKVSRNKQETIAQLEAGRIASWISWALEGGIALARTESELEAGLTGRPRPSDFMILLHYKKHIDIYAKALEEEGIPFQIAGGDGFSKSAEMAELLKVLKAVTDPDNPVRLVAVLRGCFFGISDNQLWRFKQAGGCFNFDSELPEGLERQDREVFEWAFSLLRSFRDWVQSLPASAALEKIMIELGVVPYALTGELGKSRSSYLFQGLEFFAAAEGRGAASFASLVDYLTVLMESNKSDVEEELNVMPWEDDAVRLMNLHKAKGLEAPVVFLADSGKPKSERMPAFHISRVGDIPRGYFIVERQKSYTSETLGQPLDWERYSAVEEEYLAAEEIRLLYVAATRAKNLLVVSRYPSAPQKSPWQLFNSYFDGVPELEEVESSKGTAEGTGIEITGQDLAASSPLSLPSYSVRSVTYLAQDGREGPSRNSAGRGQSWGRAIHRVLEVCAQQRPSNLDPFVEKVLAEEGRPLEEKEEVITLVNEIAGSPLWQRMLKSKKRLVEVPFSIKAAAGEYGFTCETIISGTIDLAFLEEDGWVIADYKTDTVESETQLAELVNYYTPQVKMYRKSWEALAKTKVHEAGLYFTHLNRWIAVWGQQC